MAYSLQRFQDQADEATIIAEIGELGITPRIIETDASRKLRHLIWLLTATVDATYNVWIKLYNTTTTPVSGTTEPVLVWPLEFVATTNARTMRGGIIWEEEDIRPIFSVGITAVAAGQAGNLFTSFPANLTLNIDLGTA